LKYITAADTDIGISKKINQDSICVKNAEIGNGRAALVMICDGMGGLSKGELASATVVRSFAQWFDNEFPYELDGWNWETAGKNVLSRIQELNRQLTDYGRRSGFHTGTTAAGILAVNSQMMTFHVGDSRIYKLSYRIKQLTEDHTFINREIKAGRMTPQQAMLDPRRNALTQCIGATESVSPDIRFGSIENGANYLICSDGFRHVINEQEILTGLSPERITTKSSMQAKIRELIETVKERNERDNISAAIFRAEF